MLEFPKKIGFECVRETNERSSPLQRFAGSAQVAIDSDDKLSTATLL